MALSRTMLLWVWYSLQRTLPLWLEFGLQMQNVRLDYKDASQGRGQERRGREQGGLLRHRGRGIASQLAIGLIQHLNTRNTADYSTI